MLVTVKSFATKRSLSENGKANLSKNGRVTSQKQSEELRLVKLVSDKAILRNWCRVVVTCCFLSYQRASLVWMISHFHMCLETADLLTTGAAKLPHEVPPKSMYKHIAVTLWPTLCL